MAIPNQSPTGFSPMLDYTRGLELALGRVVRDAQREVETYKAQTEALLAAMHARLTETELRCNAAQDAAARAVDARLATVRDGSDVDMDAVLQRVDDALATIPAPKDGASVDPEAVRAMVAEAVAGIPAPKDGESIDPAEIERMIADAVAAIPAPKDGASVDPEAVRAMVDETVAAAVAEIEPAPPLDYTDRIEEAVARAVDAIPAPKDGHDADPEMVREMVQAAVGVAVAAIEPPEAPDYSDAIRAAVGEAMATLPPAEPGRDADPADIERMVAAAIAEIPPPKDGTSPTVDELKTLIADAMPSREELRGAPGRLPMVRDWTDTVHYEGAVVAHRGSLWQAAQDTGRQPPHPDWMCIVKGGDDGRTPEFRGTYEEGDEHRALDVVALNGGSFVALRDNPGKCPGDGWQLLNSRGKPGQSIRGERGVKGDPGDDAATPLALVATDDLQVVLTLSDGTELKADLFPILQRVVKSWG